jgi:hypothetical protein
MTDVPTGTFASMSDDDLRSLVERCRQEERRSRDAGRKHEWIQLRQDAENELARRGLSPPS